MSTHEQPTTGDATGPSVGTDADGSRPDGHDRPETAAERADRNFEELLQELRVAQTGVQILLAFQLTIAFAPGFAQLSEGLRDLYAVTVMVTAAAMAFLVGPVAVHRASFRIGRKEQILLVSHRLAVAGLTLLAAAVVGSVYLASWAAAGGAVARVLASVVLVCLLTCWLVLPLLVRRTREEPADGQR